MGKGAKAEAAGGLVTLTRYQIPLVFRVSCGYAMYGYLWPRWRRAVRVEYGDGGGVCRRSTCTPGSGRWGSRRGTTCARSSPSTMRR